MNEFKNYMEKNVYYEYLKNYYQSEDIASIYGVSNHEIKHSNVLRWILEPKSDEAIDYLPIRNLLKLIQDKNNCNDYFNVIDIASALITNVQVKRERYNIDILITLKLNSENYIIVIENKLESGVHDNQLKDYKDTVLNKYKSYKPLFVLLYSGYDAKSKEEADKLNYISITYQEIYDSILNNVAEFTNNLETKNIINDYIHCLACYNTDTIPVLIVTDKERKCLKSLFEDEQINKMLDNLYNNKNDEYTQFYHVNKLLFMQMFYKYSSLYSTSENAVKMKKILRDKSYILNGTHHNGIGELLKVLFNTLLESHDIEELKDLINLYPDSVPLLIEEHEIDNLDTKTHKGWYLNNPKLVEKGGKTYYVLSAWTLKEYEDLKERVNALESDVFKDIVME